jgi:hypothetical protein
MYLEAIRALQRSTEFPEALHVVAYELREFMNFLPVVLDLPTPDHSQMKSRVMNLVADWERATNGNDNHDGKQWIEVDSKARVLLGRLDRFMRWCKASIPDRHASVRAILAAVTPGNRRMPDRLVSDRVRQWSDLLGYFNRITHHERPDPDDLRQSMRELEEFLLDLLEPKTFEEQDAIDALIAAVEKKP